MRHSAVCASLAGAVPDLTASPSQVEAFLANFLPTILGPLLLGANLAVTSLWLVIRIVETVYGHSGYSIPWSPFEMFWWQVGCRCVRAYPLPAC